MKPSCTVNGGAGQQPVNQVALRRAWESSQRSTKEDWAEWMRHFSVELLKESPSPALRATHTLAQVRCTLLSVCMLYQPGSWMRHLLGTHHHEPVTVGGASVLL